jgi:hypothetical protein
MAMEQRRKSLIEEVKSELKKEAAAIDPDFIDRRIDELYALDGLTPPKLDDETICAAARSVLTRAAWRRRNTLAKEARKHRFTRRTVRGAVAACCLIFFTLSANYITTRITGSCLPSKVGIIICCGTKYCICDMDKMKATDRP